MVIIGVSMKLKGFREYLKRLNRSETTITSYCNAIELYQKSGYRFTFENACAWKEQQIETMSPNTVNARIYAVNAYSRYREAGWQLSPLQTTTSQYVDHQLTMQQYLIRSARPNIKVFNLYKLAYLSAAMRKTGR